MKILAAALQIQELLDGNFNWQGFVLLFLFVLMGLIAIVFPIYAGYKAFQKPPQNRDDI